MTILDTILNAVFTGAGCAIGTYLSNQFVIKKMEKIDKHIKSLRKVKR